MCICVLELHATSLCLVILLAQNVHSASVLGSVVLGQPPLWLTRMLKAQQSIRILLMQQFDAGCLILADLSYHFFMEPITVDQEHPTGQLWKSICYKFLDGFQFADGTILDGWAGSGWDPNALPQMMLSLSWSLDLAVANLLWAVTSTGVPAKATVCQMLFLLRHLQNLPLFGAGKQGAAILDVPDGKWRLTSDDSCQLNVHKTQWRNMMYLQSSSLGQCFTPILKSWMFIPMVANLKTYGLFGVLHVWHVWKHWESLKAPVVWRMLWRLAIPQTCRYF